MVWWCAEAAGDQFSFSLIYLQAAAKRRGYGWGSILVFPDILVVLNGKRAAALGINSRFP